MKIKYLIPVVLFLFLGSICLAAGEESTTQIVQANIHYQNKEYQAAAKIYEHLIDEGYKNGHLYYNLGNTYFRLGQMGPAILNYLKAKSLIPRDKDLDANLKTAYQETIDHLEAKQNDWLFWVEDFSRNELIQFLIITNLLFWLAMTGRLFFNTGFFDFARKTLLGLLILATVTVGARYYLDTHSLTGVVLEKTVDVKSNPVSDTITLFQLHEGAVADILEKKDNWYKIELPDDKRGWVRKEAIGT